MEDFLIAFAKINLADWLKIVGVFLAVLGLFLNFLQQRKSNYQRRTENITDILRKIYDEKDLAKIYYSIEYEEFEYNETFHGSDLEVKLDRLIINFDILAKQYSLGLVSLSDLDLISYEYLVIYQNTNVQEYFTFLDEWFRRRGIRHPPFHEFRKLGKELEKRQ